MENTVSGTSFALCMDERINVEEQPLYVGYKGASSLVLRKQQTTGQIGTNNVHFDITPPARCIVDKRVFIDLEAEFTFTQLDAAGNPVDEVIFGTPRTVGGKSYVDTDTDALRFLPFQQCCNSVNVVINNTSITENTNSYIEALSRAGWHEDWINHDGSMAPLYHDNYHDYNTATGGNAPLRGPKGAQNTRYMPRGYIPMEIDNDDAGNNTALVKVKWSEPVLLPLLGHSCDEKGFVGINQMNFEFNYQNLHKMWSTSNVKFAAANRRTNISVNITSARMRMTYLVPPENLALPELNKYPYYGMTRYTSNSQVMPTVGLGEGDGLPFNLQNINLGGIPSRIFFWVSPINSVKESKGEVAPEYTTLAGWAIPDTYASIDRINLDFNGRSAVLSDANQYDLYRMSVKDVQLDQTFPDWQFNAGGVIGLSPFSLPLDSLQCSGSRGNVDFQLRVWARNHSAKLDGQQFQLNCVIVDEGVWTVAAGGQSYLEITDVSPSNVLEGKYITYSHRLTPGDLTGGIFGFLKKAARGVGKAMTWAAKNAPKAISAVKRGVELAEKYAPAAASTAMKVAPLLAGLGYSQAEIEQIMSKKTGGGPWTAAGLAADSGLSAAGLQARGGRSYRKKK